MSELESKQVYGSLNTIPFGPAPGAINGRSKQEIVDKILDIARSNAAFIKWGSTTYNGGPGNEGITYYHNKVTGQTANSMGLPNIGHQEAVQLQAELQPQVEEYGKDLIPSFSPGQGEDPLEVLPAMAAGFVNAGAKKIEANYSCPNKFIKAGNLEPVLGYDLDAMFEIDERIVAEVGEDIMIIRKPPPYLGERRAMIPDVADGFARAKGRVALALYNTIGGQQILNERGEPALAIGIDQINLGGLSGRAYREVGREGLKAFKSMLPSHIEVYSSGGVDSAEEIWHRVNELGANYAEGVTILWENEQSGQSFGQTISELSYSYAEILMQS